MSSPPSRRELAELVAEYIAHLQQVYASRAWMTARSALARLVQGADRLDYPSLRAAALELAGDDALSKSYRRDCINTWRRFLAWCVEYDALPADLVHRFQCVRLRFPLNRDECRIPPHELTSPSPATPPASPAPTTRPSLGRRPGCITRTAPDPRRDPAGFAVAMIRALPRMSEDLRDIVFLLALTGARPLELLSLTTAAVDTSMSPWVATIERHKTLEITGRPRFLVFTPRAAVRLDKHLRAFCPHDFLFPAPKDPTRHITTDLVQKRLRRVLRSHDLPSFTLYDLRRWAATTSRRSGDLHSAQALLGHSRASTTEIYAPPDLSRAIDAASNLEELLP